VTDSSRSDIPIGSVLVSIDSKDAHTLCNETITKLLQQPNRSFNFELDKIQKFLKKCLEANNIYASREGQNNKLIVTQSSRSDVPIGTVIVSIDCKDVQALCNETISKLLQQPNRFFEFDILIQKCLEANNIYASRKGQNNKLIVTQSVTSQHILYYCTYYSVSFTCSVHCTYYTYCTLYI